MTNLGNNCTAMPCLPVDWLWSCGCAVVERECDGRVHPNLTSSHAASSSLNCALRLSRLASNASRPRDDAILNTSSVVPVFARPPPPPPPAARATPRRRVRRLEIVMRACVRRCLHKQCTCLSRALMRDAPYWRSARHDQHPI
jgi:hypothetical protein